MKKIILLGIAAAGFYVAIKVNSTIKAINSLIVEISKINDLRFYDGKINLNINLKIENTSEIDLDISTLGYISIKKIKFYNKENRKIIGEANVFINSIAIPKNQTLILANIKCEIPYNNILNNLSLLDLNSSNSLSIVPVFSAGGKEYEINPENFV